MLAVDYINGGNYYLSLARAVRGHDTPSVLLGKLDGRDGLRDRADLVHLEQQRVGGTA